MTGLPSRLAGRFAVKDKIGQGAIAEVVRAHDERTGADVALKILYPALRDSPVVVERFRREVDFVRQIRHPHVLTIHEVVEADERLFLVMQHHLGGDLADRIARQGPLPPEDLAALAWQLGSALEAAHRAGVVHRDVKPSNVLVGPGPKLDVRLCDFGLARSAEGTGLTTQAAVLGTPEYMAPEVIAEGHADPRSDVYSLGVVLFEAATGRVPFAADSPYQLMRMHLEQEAPAARVWAPDLPATMQAAIARALAKDPLDRFASAGQLAEAFAATETTQPFTLAGLVRPPPSPDRVCASCGGWLVQSLRVCADCGHASLILEYEEQGGVGVMVTGPGVPGDKIEARAHVGLHRLLAELPSHAHDRDELPAQAPRFPFYVARDLTPASAETLIERLAGLGLQARTTTGWLFGPIEMRSKVNKIAGRFATAIGVSYWSYQLVSMGLQDMKLGLWVRLAIAATFFFIPLSMGVAYGVRSSKPLIGQGKPDHETPLPQLLARAVARIESRQDRRLLGRICDQLPALEHTEAAAVRTALTKYTVDLAEGLRRIEEAHHASAQAAEAPGAAQMALRKMERGRVLLRTRLLRVLAELEALGAAELVGQAGAAQTQLQAAREFAQEWAFDAEAEKELAALLALPRPGAPA